jgi:hypothetical protein
VVVTLPQTRVVLSDGGTRAVLSTREVASRGASQGTPGLSPGQPSVSAGRGGQSMGYVLLPYGFNTTQVAAFVLLVNGEEAVVAGRYMTSEEKAEAYRAHLAALESASGAEVRR